MSKYRFQESDIYLPGTDIPVNRLGLEDADLLRAVEESLLQQAYQAFIVELSPEIRFDEAYFRALHQRSFSTLYDWAGLYRSVDMAKGGSLFCRAAYLEQESGRIFRQLEAEGFLKDARDWPKPRFAERLAYYQGELVALHPFLELNGRVTRLFIDLIAIFNGYGPIDYSHALEDGEPNAYIRASIACVQQADIDALQQVILDGLCKVDDMS
ncbi:MAG: Fic family protein [Sulfuritalea sp.]|nr:Fic family protein [Sulfuritalea sp.]